MPSSLFSSKQRPNKSGYSYKLHLGHTVPLTDSLHLSFANHAHRFNPAQGSYCCVIAIAKVARTLLVRHPPWHPANNQPEPVSYGCDSSAKTNIAQSSSGRGSKAANSTPHTQHQESSAQCSRPCGRWHCPTPPLDPVLAVGLSRS